MDMDFLLVGSRIRQARKLRGMAADVLSARVGLTAESLRHIETGVSKPSLQTLFRIADALDVSMDYLAGRGTAPEDAVTADYSDRFGLNDAQAHMLRDVFDSIVPIITTYV